MEQMPQLDPLGGYKYSCRCTLSVSHVGELVDERREEKLFEAYVKMAELAAARFDRRRSYEWKILLGLWAVVLMAVYKKFSVPHFDFCVLVVIQVLFTATWICGVWAANASDKTRYEYYYRLAHNVLTDKDTEPPAHAPALIRRGAAFNSFDFWRDWNSQFQFLATSSLLLLLYFSQPEPVPPPRVIEPPASTGDVPAPVPGPVSRGVIELDDESVLLSPETEELFRRRKKSTRLETPSASEGR
jgi:hypothetical protein